MEMSISTENDSPASMNLHLVTVQKSSQVWMFLGRVPFMMPVFGLLLKYKLSAEI
nr:unnamed protein product [Callosobruchus analis]